MKYLNVLTALLVASSLATPLAAQNVSNYGMIPQPLLFLLREPAVHADLGLSAQQEQRLVEFNESVDGILLATRNVKPEEAQKEIAQVMKESREQLALLLTREQQERLRQIAYRLRGISFVLTDDASRQLRLTDQQKQDIESIVKQTAERVNQARTETYAGEEAHQQSQRAIISARTEEQQRILELLNDRQKQDLLTLVGRPFDPSTLGLVSFKAPPLAGGDQWINSEPLKLSDLRGKVVALHFWAFG